MYVSISAKAHWLNRYRRSIWTQLVEIQFWTGLLEFYFLLMKLIIVRIGFSTAALNKEILGSLALVNK